MEEKSHADLRYKGNVGETVTVTVTVAGTVPMMTFKLDGGPSLPVPPTGIQLQLHAGTNLLELTFDSVPPGGVYTVIVKTVTNESNNQCLQTFSPLGIPISAAYRFFA
ncbi:MAG TPA: hypothetical protein VN696_11635 [Pyrinomonadaceae bacterium]|nr:hypothetical protein [Pyrinomonadaceae bacterium]